MISTSTGDRRKLDFELNIIPVIDCLTILVTFMLAAGIYYSIAMLEVKLSMAGAAAQSEQKAVSLQVALSADQRIVVKISGNESREIPIPQVNGKPDTETLGLSLQNVRAKWPDVNSVTLESQKDVSYQSVVSVLESIRKSHPDVVLGGF